MNPLSSKAHSLAQTRQTKHRTNRTQNQHERATKRIFATLAPKFRACADVIQLCLRVRVSVLSMRTSKNVGLQTLCACSVQKTRTRSRPRPPI